MNEVVSNAGLQDAVAAQAKPAVQPSNPRREAIKVIRSTLRKVDASDDEVDDALEALLELAKD